MGKSSSVPTFPRATQTLRTNRLCLIRLMGEPRKSCQNFFSLWRPKIGELKPLQRSWHSKARFRTNLGEPVPRTSFQAIVTSIDPITDQAAELERDSSFVFDR